jgi:hypothetical protein
MKALKQPNERCMVGQGWSVSEVEFTFLDLGSQSYIKRFTIFGGRWRKTDTPRIVWQDALLEGIIPSLLGKRS